MDTEDLFQSFFSSTNYWHKSYQDWYQFYDFWDSGHLFANCPILLQLKYVTSLISFLFLLLLSLTSAALTLEVRVVESLLFLYCFFFLSFLALSEGSES